MIRTRSETPKAGHNAAGKLRAFLERIERLQEERKALGDDIADVFKELESDGYSKDAAKIVLKIRASEDGLKTYTAKSDTVDAYLVALGIVPSDEDRAGARARENIEEFGSWKAETGIPVSLPAHDPITGEIADHASDCAVHNEPAFPAGECDCGATDVPAPRLSAAVDGQPSIPSSDAGGAKMEERVTAVPERAADEAGSSNTQSEQAVTIPDAEIPAFLKADHPQPNERCQRLTKDCKHAFNQHGVTCSQCGSAWAIAQRKRAAA